MRPELETYEQIDLFLNGELEGDALRSFEQKMAGDSAFAEEVRLQKIANEVVKGASLQDLREQMSADLQKMDASSGKWKIVSIAVGFIALSSSVLYFATKSNNPADKKTPESTTHQTSIQKAEGVRAAEKIKMDNVLAAETATHTSGNTTTPATTVDSTSFHQSDVLHHLNDNTPVSSATVPHSRTEDVLAEHTEEPQNSDPCASVYIEAAYSIAASCPDKNTGSIRVPQSSIKGGAAPYTVRLDKSRTLQNSDAFSNLAADSYTLYITDQAGCAKTYPVEVPEKTCNPFSSVFAPDKGEIWKYTGSGHISYTLTIVNMAGQQVYRTPQMQGVFEWQGLSQKGEYLDAGLYIYVAEYTDGTKENGQVTIAK
ncbi:MAG: gliding motility-associated C-terminal domain-containing protein [Cytophaga sp.]|uniref:T9SS type B sorting domain-containing protein n=1 Tax=Cytophaga sp. TaxID=29535 RepID=UPI003F7F789E